MGNASSTRGWRPGLQAVMLLAAGALVVAGALAVGATSRAGARRAFRAFLESADAGVAEHARAVRPQIAATLDRACCDRGELEAASARLGPDLALFVFEERTRAFVGASGPPLVQLREVAVRWDGQVVVLEAERPAEGGPAEQVVLRFEGQGARFTLTDGRAARLHLAPIAHPVRVRAALAVLGRWNGRALAVAGGLALASLLVTWLATWRTARAARDIEAALRGIAAGRLDSRVAPSGPRELADLGRAFNQAADELQRRRSAEETP